MNNSIPLVEQLKALEHLQEFDLKIDNLKKNRTSLPEGLKGLDLSLNKLRASSETKKKTIEEHEKTQRQTRAALDLNNDRLTRSASRLEGVQNSQEYSAVNKEVDQLKKMNASLEEQNKKSDADIGAIKKDLGDLTAQMEKIQAERDSQANVVAGQSGQIEAEINSLMTERAKYTAQIDPRTVAQYDRVRGARAGIGFVPAVGGRCKGCNMVVPPQLYNEIRKVTAVHSCPSCHRILFVPVSTGEAAGTSST